MGFIAYGTERCPAWIWSGMREC
ncbi:unnamed protein product [Podospora anserina S mat+]|uniref:Podospora anserina S mat+ genomic DNA chromosome 1, supercontig 5 n=1 Tax=Podospora anserina (strain S / ATCC MYA-4624 / DSM 980 / FGSC 10383) TaxID=515849 RepID=B2ABH5_PODAN|nr:unnamed protein product [Podospora anserina S mat+]